MTGRLLVPLDNRRRFHVVFTRLQHSRNYTLGLCITASRLYKLNSGVVGCRFRIFLFGILIVILETLSNVFQFAPFEGSQSSVKTLAAMFLLLGGVALWFARRHYTDRNAARSAAVLECLDEGVGLVADDGSIVFSNAAFSRLLKATCEAPGTRIVSGSESEIHKPSSTLQSILASEEKETRAPFEFVFKGACSLHVTVRAFSEGTRLVVIRELAAEPEVEDAVGERLSTLQHELERSHRELENFTYVASHDLKEPLRGLTINANFLTREEALSAVGRDRVARMIGLCHRMEQLISDLLFFSQLGRPGRTLENVDPAHIVSTLRISLTETLDERSGTIAIATELPLVHAESAKIKTVFQNLIVNALKYNDALRKVVTIGFRASVEIDGRTLQDMFYVADNGIGIDERNRDRIFGIFSRLNSEKAYGAGTGAGLAFVKKIVEDYGGEITFASRPGKGSTFYFSLPIVDLAGIPPVQTMRSATG